MTKCGLDAYFFLRYVRSMLLAFAVLAVLLLPVLLPVAHIHDSFKVTNQTPTASNDTVQHHGSSRAECRATHTIATGVPPLGRSTKIVLDSSASSKTSESAKLVRGYRVTSIHFESLKTDESLTVINNSISHTSISVIRHRQNEGSSIVSEMKDDPHPTKFGKDSSKTGIPISVRSSEFDFYDIFRNCTTTRSTTASSLGLVPSRIIQREDGIDNFNFSNVPWNHPSRYWAYLLMSLLVISLMSWVIWRETQVYVKHRTKWLLSARHRAIPGAATVLFLNMPTQDLTIDKFTKMFNVTAGSIQHVWVNADNKRLDKLEMRRREMVLEFEGAELDLLKHIHRAQWRAQLKTDIEQPMLVRSYHYPTKSKMKDTVKDVSAATAPLSSSIFPHLPNLETIPTIEHQDPSQSLSKLFELGDNESYRRSKFSDLNVEISREKYKSLWRSWIEQNDRPKLGHKCRLIPRCLMRPLKSIDKVDHFRQNLHDIDEQILEERSKSMKCLPCVFVRYYRRDHAIVAAQRTYGSPIKVGLFEPIPQQILWRNLRPASYKLSTLRVGTTWAVMILLIATWAVPVWIIGMITVIVDRLEEVDGRASVRERHPIIGALTWILAPLPPALIGLLMTNLPNIMFRPLARWQGALTKSNAEIATHRMSFAFAFFQVFLINSLSSGIVAWVELALHAPSTSAENPASRFVGPSIWARFEQMSTSLSQTSRWCMAYLTYQALVNSTATFVQFGHLVWRAWTTWQKQTPRQVARRRFHMPQQRWGPSYALLTVMACMVLTYCVAQPLVLIFGITSFGMLLLTYKYNVLYVWETRCESDGRHYPWALRHTFVGLYTLTIYMAILFFTQVGCKDNFASVPQGICMIATLPFLILYQIKIQRKYSIDIKWGNSGPLDGQDVEEFARGAEGVHDFVKNGEKVIAWIPGDMEGVPEDECRAAPRGVRMTCEGAYIDNGVVVVTSPLAGKVDLCCKTY